MDSHTFQVIVPPPSIPPQKKNGEAFSSFIDYIPFRPSSGYSYEDASIFLKGTFKKKKWQKAPYQMETKTWFFAPVSVQKTFLSKQRKCTGAQHLDQYYNAILHDRTQFFQCSGCLWTSPWWGFSLLRHYFENMFWAWDCFRPSTVEAATAADTASISF